MAKYAINLKGIEMLKKLDLDMFKFSNEMEESGKRLISAVNALEDQLGEFSEDIIELVGKVQWELEAGREPIEELRKEIKRQTENIQIFLTGKISQR